MLPSEGAVSTSSSSPILVDCDVLEAAKENVQPLGTGRRVTALSTILATPHAQREAKLQSTRNRLRINVELALASSSSDEQEDETELPETNALDAYWNFVNWTLDNYPQGHSAESGLLELLEEATRVLKDHQDGRWRGDIKYLKLWLLYASYVENPVIIYKFLVCNEIGTGWALLYEEYAAVLERDKRRKEADEAYSLGIARCAVPLDHLQERYSDFQKRMMSNIMLPSAPPIPSASQKPRAALATTSFKPPTPSTVTASSSSTSGQTPRSVSTPVPIPVYNTNNSTKLQIFADPTGASSSDQWQHLGTRKSRIKENVPEVKKIAGTTLRQPGKSKRVPAAAPSGSNSSVSGSRSMSGGFVVLRDSGSEDSSANMPPPSVAAATPATPSSTITLTDSASNVKKAGLKAPRTMSSEAEALRKDPLRNYQLGDNNLNV